MSEHTSTASALAEQMVLNFGRGGGSGDGVVAAAAANTLASGSEKPLEFISRVDAFVESHPTLVPLREYFFDLAMLAIIEDGTRRNEDFLDSQEMEKIEDATLDRGTEFLNLLVYIQDCRLNEVQASVGDYLNDFLLVEEEDFQDEFFLYEDVIKNQKLTEGPAEQIFAYTEKVDDDEIRGLFAAMFLFFSSCENEGKDLSADILRFSANKATDMALYGTLMYFYSRPN